MPALEVQRFAFRTIPALLRQTAARVPARRFLRELTATPHDEGVIEWSFANFERAVAGTSEFLARAGFAPGDRVLFVAENSRDYQVLSVATQALRAVPSVAFANLSAAAVCDIALRVRPRCVFVSTQEQWDKLGTVAQALIASGLVLRISPVALLPVEHLRDERVSELENTECDRSRWEARVDAVGPEDPFLLLFTSGTTGRQKGVILHQDAFVRSLEGGRTATGMTELDDGLMFLPFAHIAGQCQFMLAIALGHSLIMVSHREALPKAFTLGPTYSFAVPMVYEKLRERVTTELDSLPWPVRPLLKACVGTCAAAPKPGFHPVPRVIVAMAQSTIGRRLKQSLGGRLRMVASGGAVAAPSLARFFESMGLPFISLYGMSETCGLIASQSVAGLRTPGSVGQRSPDLELRINETSELCVKGPMLMRRYLEDEDNSEAFDEEGYFRTGDLAKRDAQTDEISLIGRSKSLLVLSTGKKLSPEPIEEHLSTLPPIGAAMLVGESRPYVSAILFVVPGALESLGKTKSVVAKALHQRLARHLDGFSDYERPKRLLVVPSLPADHPNFVTPTLKLKRSVILEAYASEIDRLYQSADELEIVA
jgi:long-chain acyl-CoA synthetase